MPILYYLLAEVATSAMLPKLMPKAQPKAQPSKLTLPGGESTSMREAQAQSSLLMLAQPQIEPSLMREAHEEPSEVEPSLTREAELPPPEVQ